MSNILQAKRNETVRFPAKISPGVFADLNKVKERIKTEAPNLSLDIDTVVDKAIASAVKKANKELDGLPEQHSQPSSSL